MGNLVKCVLRVALITVAGQLSGCSFTEPNQNADADNVEKGTNKAGVTPRKSNNQESLVRLDELKDLGSQGKLNSSYVRDHVDALARSFRSPLA